MDVIVSGRIPDSFSQLVNLHYLQLHNNALEGTYMLSINGNYNIRHAIIYVEMR